MRVLRCGDHAVLVEVPDLDAVTTLHAALRAASPRGVQELVPAARTLLVRFDPAVTSGDAVRDALGRVSPVPVPDRGDADEVEIAVRYDGEDLDDVAAFAGLSVRDVVARHAAGRYRSAFCGFAPGFAYLTGLDPALRVPRLDEPRTAVPAGAVAVAAEFTAVYPRSSPGGWRILGRTDATVWDVDRDPPALLQPGTWVRFRPVRT